jgi:hypothetical protein
LSTVTVWESGLTCDAPGCGGEFILGEEILWYYGRKLHQRCASQDAAGRRSAAGEDEPVLAVAGRQLEAGGRVILTRRQIRELTGMAAAVPGFEPVRKPDSGKGRRVWYGRMPGWDADRVHAGLAAPEVAGLWLDFLEAGRLPPLRAADVASLLGAIRSPDVTVISP